jgi:hypothetical protein
MNSTVSRPKKSPSSKARRKAGRGCVRSASRSPSKRSRPSVVSSRSRRAVPAWVGPLGTAALRREFREWRASLATQLERDTLLMPEAIANSAVGEVSRYLNVELPGALADHLAAKAYYLYGRHRHFHKKLNERGDGGRDNLYMYMRHWTAGWLKRERYALFNRLPREYALGKRLP